MGEGGDHTVIARQADNAENLGERDGWLRRARMRCPTAAHERTVRSQGCGHGARHYQQIEHGGERAQKGDHSGAALGLAVRGQRAERPDGAAATNWAANFSGEQAWYAGRQAYMQAAHQGRCRQALAAAAAIQGCQRAPLDASPAHSSDSMPAASHCRVRFLNSISHQADTTITNNSVVSCAAAGGGGGGGGGGSTAFVSHLDVALWVLRCC